MIMVMTLLTTVWLQTVVANIERHTWERTPQKPYFAETSNLCVVRKTIFGNSSFACNQGHEDYFLNPKVFKRVIFG